MALLLASSTAFRTIVPHRAAIVVPVSRRYLFGSPEPPKDKKGGMFGGLGDMMGNMKKMQEVTKLAQELQKDLAETIVVGQDGNNLVVVTYTATGKPISMKISEEAMNKGADALSAAASKAMLSAHEKGTEVAKSKTEDLFKRFGIPIPPGSF